MKITEVILVDEDTGIVRYTWYGRRRAAIASYNKGKVEDAVTGRQIRGKRQKLIDIAFRLKVELYRQWIVHSNEGRLKSAGPPILSVEPRSLPSRAETLRKISDGLDKR